MADKDKPKRQSEGVLHETFSAAEGKPSNGLSYSYKLANPHLPEIAKRRKRLIKEINAGWSLESERALSAIASQYIQKR